MEQLRLIDDIDRETVAAEKVLFSYRGKDYEIDLSAEHASKFDDQMEFWLEYARKAGTTARVVSTATTSRPVSVGQQERPEWSDPVGCSHAERDEYRKMRRDAREWALSNGWPHLGDLGRLPVDAYVAWKEAMGWTGDLFACWSNYQRKKPAVNGARNNGHLMKV